MSADASLDSLRRQVGSVSTKDDDLLAEALQVSAEWVQERIMPESWNKSVVQKAVVMGAAKLYRTRQAAEAAGMSGEGLVMRPATLAGDGNIRTLLERHLDMTNVGVG